MKTFPVFFFCNPLVFFIQSVTDPKYIKSKSYAKTFDREDLLVLTFKNEKIVSIFDVIVLSEMRGKGLGKAMTLRAMLDAQKKGFNKCILTATNDAKYLYQKIGFKDLKTMKVYHDL